MQIKIQCECCRNDIIVSSKDIGLDIYRKAGEIIQDYLYWHDNKKGGFFGHDKTRDAIQHYRLLEDIKLKYFICLCGEKNYLIKLDVQQLLSLYKTEKFKLELLEWKNDMY